MAPRTPREHLSLTQTSPQSPQLGANLEHASDRHLECKNYTIFICFLKKNLIWNTRPGVFQIKLRPRFPTKIYKTAQHKGKPNEKQKVTQDILNAEILL